MYTFFLFDWNLSHIALLIFRLNFVYTKLNNNISDQKCTLTSPEVHLTIIDEFQPDCGSENCNIPTNIVNQEYTDIKGQLDSRLDYFLKIQKVYSYLSP